MSGSEQLVVFRLDEKRYALPLLLVERIVRAAAVTLLPKGPDILLGVINIAGSVLPVLNVRRRFKLPEREINPADHFLIAHAPRHPVVLVVDEAQEVIQRRPEEIVRPAQIVSGLDHIQGVLKLDDGLVLIHDLQRFLSLDEARALEDAIIHERPHGN
jgi:purine-binding chemotaxis protein CheW